MNDYYIKKIKKKIEDRGFRTLEVLRDFSVLILITEKKDGIHFVFEKRAAGIKQPGDVCFPGGKVEGGESWEECALRETKEEIGIENIEVLGHYATQYELTSIAMHGIVGFVEEDELKKIKVNEAEVAEVFTVPAAFFKETEPFVYEYNILQDVSDFPYDEMGISSDYKWRVGKKEIAVYHYGDKIIWGLTAAFVRNFVKELCPNKWNDSRNLRGFTNA